MNLVRELKKIATELEKMSQKDGLKSRPEDSNSSTDFEWCTCGNPSGEVEFYDSEEEGEEGPEYYVCADCGGLVQVS